MTRFPVASIARHDAWRFARCRWRINLSLSLSLSLSLLTRVHVHDVRFACRGAFCIFDSPSDRDKSDARENPSGFGSTTVRRITRPLIARRNRQTISELSRYPDNLTDSC